MWWRHTRASGAVPEIPNVTRNASVVCAACTVERYDLPYLSVLVLAGIRHGQRHVQRYALVRRYGPATQVFVLDIDSLYAIATLQAPEFRCCVWLPT